MDVVIGIGNELRGDDAVGAQAVARLSKRDDLRTMSVHQLVPELAEAIHGVDRVLFVDARLGSAASGGRDRGETIALDRVEPGSHHGLGHACSPGALLGWTKVAFGEAPEAWLLSIPGTAFEVGESISPQTAALLPEAVDRIESWLRDETQT